MYDDKTHPGHEKMAEWAEDKYLPLLLYIETAILDYYRKHPGIKDRTVIPILESLSKNPEMKSQHELLKNIQNDLRLNLSVYTYSKAEVKGSLKRVLKSVKSHRRTGGAQGYLQFIDEFFSRRNPY